MRKPPGAASGKPKGSAGSAFPGGGAMERVRQFERARGLGPPKTANAPAMPEAARAKRPRKTRKK